MPTEAFTEKGIEIKNLTKCNIKYFHRPRKKELYSPPHLLIRKVLGKEKLITQYVDRYLTFVSDIFSIHTPSRDKSELVSISNYLESKGALLRFYILSTSSRVKVNKATSLYDEDILNIPYPVNLTEINLSLAEEIVFKDSLLYFLNSDTKDLSKQNFIEDKIPKFSSSFCKTLNSIYQSEGKNFQLFKILDAGNYYALHFEYTAEAIKPITEQTEDLEEYIQQVIPEKKEKGQVTHIQRIMKVYGQDCIILIKPKQLRYWLPSIALRDADETFADYIKARYQHA